MPDGELRPWADEKWPTVSRETIVDVVVPFGSLADEIERQKLSIDTEQPILPAGAELRFRVSQNSVPDRLRSFLLDGSDAYPDPGSMVAVTLLEQLKLKLRPSRHSKLCSAQCAIPSIKMEASSLNEAYTVLSEAFEPHRRSHGGSVYLQGYYLDEGRWIQLDALRRWVEAGRPSPVI